MIKVDFYSENGYFESDEYPEDMTLGELIKDSKKWTENITEMTIEI